MKTYSEFKKINFNDYAFFKGLSVSESKWEFANHIYDSDDIENNCTASGVPKIKTNDLVDVALFDFKIRSNSKLDGKDQMEYLCDFYNKGIPTNTLREYSENKTFIKAIRFSGKYQVLNEILNKDQLKKLQESWIYKNCYSKKTYSDNAIYFLRLKNWSIPFLVSKGISIETIEEQFKGFDNRKNPKPEVETIFN